MPPIELVIPVFGIIFGSAITLYFLYKVFGLAQSFIDRKKTGLSENKARELVDFMNRTEARLRSLEQIIVDQDFLDDKRTGELADIETEEERRSRLPNKLKS